MGRVHGGAQGGVHLLCSESISFSGDKKRSGSEPSCSLRQSPSPTQCPTKKRLSKYLLNEEADMPTGSDYSFSSHHSIPQSKAGEQRCEGPRKLNKTSSSLFSLGSALHTLLLSITSPPPPLCHYCCASRWLPPQYQQFSTSSPSRWEWN